MLRTFENQITNFDNLILIILVDLFGFLISEWQIFTIKDGMHFFHESKIKSFNPDWKKKTFSHDTVTEAPDTWHLYSLPVSHTAKVAVMLGCLRGGGTS